MKATFQSKGFDGKDFMASLRALALRGLVVAGLAVAAVLVLALRAGGAAAAGDCSADPSLDSEERAFLKLINNYRAQSGLGSLEYSSVLSRSAQWKASDMADRNYFAHDDADRSWSDRIADCGYSDWNVAENLAAGGSGSAQQMFDSWRASAPHNANMLNPDFVSLGVGRGYNASSQYKWYWATDFGSVSDEMAADGWYSAGSDSDSAGAGSSDSDSSSRAGEAKAKVKKVVVQ